MAIVGQKPVLTQEMTMTMIETCVHKANELGIAVNIMVMDDGGNPKGFLRMDKASLIGQKIAHNKAYTAVGFGIPTSEWYSKIKDKPELQGIAHIDNMIILGGGLPIYHDSHLIGGIGVSGGTSEQDIICAQAALDALAGRS
ncbi:heme-binding protein [Paenibacillus sp. tmac-D7]|uniref:GlcG/HbpS family heme-binding protein n=1 Tax=Paenibacillus sp. tmac-D7 TaxID=2591462 RepID=UPI0011422780|nr:heme-binding protein [Paenibacillus sp. tmac-D7]